MFTHSCLIYTIPFTSLYRCTWLVLLTEEHFICDSQFWSWSCLYSPFCLFFLSQIYLTPAGYTWHHSLHQNNQNYTVASTNWSHFWLCPYLLFSIAEISTCSNSVTDPLNSLSLEVLPTHWDHTISSKIASFFHGYWLAFKECWTCNGAVSEFILSSSCTSSYSWEDIKMDSSKCSDFAFLMLLC